MNTKKWAILGIIAVIVIVTGVYAYTNGLLTGGVPPGQTGTITVLAGAGFVHVTNDLKAEFEKEHPEVTVNVRNGGSGELFAILATQKSADIFLPADYKYMEDAVNKGYIQKNTVRNITHNIPVIAVQKGNPKNITSLNDFAKSGVRVALGDPKGPAIGKTSQKLLNKTNLTSAVAPNIVVKTTTVNQLLTYLVTKQADTVIIWQDMTTWPEGQGKIDVIAIPQNETIISTVPIAVTVFTKYESTAMAFEDFATGPKGLAIWEKWGFKPI
jgi:molybdate transport system substrate-binding protein